MSTGADVTGFPMSEPGSHVEREDRAWFLSQASRNPNANALPAVLLVLAALVGIVTAVVVYTFQVEYGPTTGSRIDGAIHGLTFAALPLAVAGVLAGVAFALGRRSSSLRGLAVAAIVLSIAGALVAGSQAAVTKYDRLAKVPECGAADGGWGADCPRRLRRTRAPRALRRRLERRPGLRCRSAERQSRPGRHALPGPPAGRRLADHPRRRLRDWRPAATAWCSSSTDSCGPVSVEVRLADAAAIQNQC